jgi:putative IMPACT (imprinted ancient) family translation regulator
LRRWKRQSVRQLRQQISSKVAAQNNLLSVCINKVKQFTVGVDDDVPSRASADQATGELLEKRWEVPAQMRRLHDEVREESGTGSQATGD